MFHRNRHHHHQPQHSRPAGANRQAADLAAPTTTATVNQPHENPAAGMKRHSQPAPHATRAAIGPDMDMESSRRTAHLLKAESDFGSEMSAVRRRCTSPVCATAVELAAGMVDGFRLPDHSPSPVRKQVGNPAQGRSLSAASPENNNTTSSTSSSLTGLFRRKRSPMDLSSQSFNIKSSPSSFVKPLTAPKPQRLDAGSSGFGNVEPKGRSLSPMPSGNLLAAMVMNSLHSAVLDVGQSASERQSRKVSSAALLHHQQRHHVNQTQQRQLPQLVVSAKSDDLDSNEPTSPSQLSDPRQISF